MLASVLWFLVWLLLALVVAAFLFLVAFVALRVLGAVREKREAEARVPPIGQLKPLSGGARLHAFETGAESDAPPVVLIHGAGGSLWHFSALWDALAADRRVIALDRPGYGYSFPPKGFSGSLAAQSAFLREALAALSIERPLLVGHSFGGAVALRYALDHPDAVAGLTLIAPGAYPFTPKPPFPADVIEKPAMRAVLAWTAIIPKIKELRGAIAATVFNPDPTPPDFDAKAGGALALRPGQIIAQMTDQAMLQPGLREQAPRYGEIKAPMRILIGTADAILHADEQGPPLVAACPQAALTVLEGAGHMLPLAHPEETLAAIRQTV